jgi:hypothetical protein
MAAAIFGLVGVVVGALVTGGVQFVLDRRREQLDVRRATRLVAAELKDAAYLYAALSRVEEWPAAEGHEEDYVLSTTAWNEHRAHLAIPPLNDELWDALVNSYAVLRADRGAILRSIRDHAGEPIPREKRDEFRRDSERLRELQGQLEDRPAAPERPIMGPRQ